MTDAFHKGLLDGQTVPLLDHDADNSSEADSRRESSEDVKPWDMFRDIPAEDETNVESRCQQVSIKIIKVIVYFITFIIVLGGGVVSKGALLLMTSQIRQQNRTFCRNDWDKNHQYESSISLQERIGWVWCVAFAFILPELFTFLRSARISFFKSSSSRIQKQETKEDEKGETEEQEREETLEQREERIKKKRRQRKRKEFWHSVIVCFFESLSALGMSMFAFVVLPHMNAVQGAMLTNCMCLVPAALALLSRYPKEHHRFLKMILDALAIGFQLTGLTLWPLTFLVIQSPDAAILSWSIPASLVLISFGWWENYVDPRSNVWPVKWLLSVKETVEAKRYSTYLIVSIFKIIVFLGGMMLFVRLSGIETTDLFTKFRESFGVNRVELIHKTTQSDSKTDPHYVQQFLPVSDPRWSTPNTSIYVLITQAVAALLVYIVGKFTCRIGIQGFSYAFPINLTIPVLLSLLITGCGLRSESPCFLSDIIPKYLYWECPKGDFITNFVLQAHNWLWILWLLSQTWITLHIWLPKCERLASTDKLYVTPMYAGLAIDQSVGMNRRRNEKEISNGEEAESETADTEKSSFYTTAPEPLQTTSKPSKATMIKDSDTLTRIFACATMWHETKDEMLAMLVSIFRMDNDQWARRKAKKFLSIDSDLYEFETHIFFDDAFEISDDNEDEFVVNNFVKLMVKVMDEACSKVNSTSIRLRPPKKFPTPYGGRLMWTLPGKSKMYAHLKDTEKIRHRKRWSQVMYMYYLLGHKLMALPMHADRKEKRAENTYLLALDGDIDFQPTAVRLLIDLMKKNPNLGAACGRIHPIGGGPIVWYQKFEYAIGHWLQKATEHMIGCVLCSPGCFSLFRAKGLMDDNVMKRYTTKSDEALHYVQYDQGEDRWLCTLLLQQGYRVEYSAASDAFTHAPEGFNEFYNQRRRWVPSTMANILDLLMDAKKTVKVNDNISMPYIWYQGMLMAGTILGPGTIFLMLVGAFVAAFKIDNWTSFGANVVPILLFMVVCFIAKADYQLLLAQLLTAFYSMVMMAVIVGTLLQVQEDGWTSPGTLFLMAVTLTFLIAALLHPKEFLCAAHGWLYYLLVPSMYLLLVVYSCINLNNVSWGTREVKKKERKNAEAPPEEPKEEEKKPQASNNFFGFLGMKDEQLEGGFTLGIPGLCLFQLCAHPKPKDEQFQLAKIDDTMGKILDRLNQMENSMSAPQGVPRGLPRRKSIARPMQHSHAATHNLDILNEEQDEDIQDNSDVESLCSQMSEEKRERDDLLNPYWIEDKDLKRGEVEFLPIPEIQFWKDLLGKYLYPIDSDKGQQAKVATELKELRNQAASAFFMFNALFVLIVFLLQLNKDNLYVEWPLGAKFNITYNIDTQEVRILKTYLHLEPIGLVFVFFFALIIIIQFGAMLCHRFGTLSHILSTTNMSCFSQQLDTSHTESAVQFVRRLQKQDNQEQEIITDDKGRRKTIHNLENASKRKQTSTTLDFNFTERFENALKNAGNSTSEAQNRPGFSKQRRDTLFLRRNSTLYLPEAGPPKRVSISGASSPGRSQTRPRRGTGFYPNGSLVTGRGIDNHGFDEEEEDAAQDSSGSISNEEENEKL